MGKDESQMSKEKKEKLQKQVQEVLQREHEVRRLFEESQASAFLVKDGPQLDGDQKQLIFTVPEHPKPKFLSKTTLLQQILAKEAEQLGDTPQEDNQFIFDEIMKNELIREEFEKIREVYGEDAYELNKLSLLSFIKRGKHNFTYSVKYYGIDEGQIGILSRKVPYDEFMKKKGVFAAYKPPQINELQKKEEFDLVEVEFSEEEEYEVEVDISSDEDKPLPQARMPKANIDILQGSVAGKEFDTIKKDSRPISFDNQEKPEQIQQIQIKKKTKKKIIEKRKIMKKKIVKRPKINEKSREFITDQSHLNDLNSFQMHPFNDTLQTLGSADHKNIENKKEAKKPLSIKTRSKTLKNRPQKDELQNEIDKEFKDIQMIMEDKVPYIIDFRELFKKCELHNLKEFKKPQPEKYNEHIVHQYSLPKGLHAMKRTQVLSEAEYYDKERYSKRNVQLQMVDKEYQKMNIGGQSLGMKGSKVKPIYFPFNHTTSLSTSQSQSMLFNPNSQLLQPSIMTQKLQTNPKQGSQSQLQSQKVNPQQTRNIIGIVSESNKIFVNETGTGQNKQSQVTLESIHSINKDTKPPIETRRLPGLSDGLDTSKDPISQSDQSNDNPLYNQYYAGGTNLVQKKLPSIISSNEVSHLQQTMPQQQNSILSLAGVNSIHMFDKNNSQSLVNIQTSGIMKNRVQSKNLLFGNQKIAPPSNLPSNRVVPDSGQSNRSKNVLYKNASMGNLNSVGQNIMNSNKKIPYLMDTKKLLEEKKHKKGGFRMKHNGNGHQDDSSEDEADFMIFTDKKDQANKDLYFPQVKGSQHNSNNQKTVPDVKDLRREFGSEQKPIINTSNVKVVCRIRAPKTYACGKETFRASQAGTISSACKSYTSVRNRSRSNSKDVTNASPYSKSIMFNDHSSVGNYASLRQTSSKESRGTNQRSSSRDNSRNRSNILGKSLSNGNVQNDKKYCIFTTKERSNVVVACENPVPGKVINDSLVDVQDLKYFNFNFDSVFNEGQKQEKFYQASIRPAVQSFVEGENATVLLFGPTEGGKTYTLKGKTGIERGILPRAVEDIFNIVRNSEEREEDYELLNNQMMRDDEDDMAVDNFPTSSRNDRLGQTKNFASMDTANIVPERMFLKVSVYQIFVDKVLDLLNGTNSSFKQKVSIDHYIDKETEEVVSKIKNITEKVVFTLEDFYGVLQEAFKNRRIESLNMQEQDLRKKSHFIINLTMMKRTQSKKLVEISSLNFVELAGSEQAVADEQFYKDTSVRQFVTKSFNGISSQIVKAALHKRTKNQQEDGDIKLLNCLRNTLTTASNIVLVCCVTPSQQSYDHSLPAVKFCARIRECILKKIGQGQTNSRREINHETQSVMSEDPVQYGMDTNREKNYGSSFETTKEIVEHLKDEVFNRQVAQKGEMDSYENERWALDKLETIERLVQRVYNSNYTEKQRLLLTSELNFIKDNILKLKFQTTLTTPKQAFGPSLADTYQKSQHLSQSSAERMQRTSTNDQQYQQSYNPYQAQSYNYMSSDLKPQSYQSDFPPERDYATQTLQKSQFIYTDEKQQDRNAQFRETRNDSHNNRNDSSTNGQRTKLRPHNLNTQNSYKKENNVGRVLSIEERLIDDFQNQSQERNQIQVYQNSYDGRQISRIQQNASHLTCAENEFLTRVHPLQEKTLSGKKNSISEHNSPEREEKNQQFTSQSQATVNFRPQNKNLNNYQRGFQQQQQQINTVAQNDPSSILNTFTQLNQSQTNTIKSPLHKLQQRFMTQLNANTGAQQKLNQSKYEQIDRKIKSQKRDSVYQSRDEALNDINRLIRLSDFEGLRLRVMQIYKEKEEQDKIIDEQQEMLMELKEQAIQKDQLLEEQDNLIKETQQEFQVTFDEINQQKNEQEKTFMQQNHNMSEQMNEYKDKLEQLIEEKEKLQKQTEILEIENRQLIKVKEEAEQKQQKTQDENDRLKGNYDILKEHEMNIIKDYEGKKTRELNFYEQKLVDLHQQIKEEQLRGKELEEQAFRQREEIRKLELENEKATDDKKHMIEQIQKFALKIEELEDNKIQLQKQIEHIDREAVNIKEQNDRIANERDKAFQEIEKLHLLVEEMEKAIENEQTKTNEQKQQREDCENTISQLQREKQTLESEIDNKNTQIEEGAQRELEFQKQLKALAEHNDKVERELTLIKAKEYDKVDILKRSAELEARIKYLQVDNENLVRERNNLDLANVNLNRDKQELESQVIAMESEIEFFRKTNEEHLDKFDSKFESISIELAKLKNENIQLKEKDKQGKRYVKEVEEERDEYRDKSRAIEKKNQDLQRQLYELETDVRTLLQEKERELKDCEIRKSLEIRLKEENKGKMFGDIQNMIKQYKDDKRFTKSGGFYSSTGAPVQNQNNNPGYSTSSSVYY